MTNSSNSDELRTIKFRAWDKEDKCFYYSDSPNADFVFGSKGNCVYMNGGLIIDLENLGQYTGLKDKNGVEIYEGDIVTRGGVVRYDNEKSAFVITYTGNEFYLGPDHKTRPLEVIGNIYENPELLSPSSQTNGGDTE